MNLMHHLFFQHLTTCNASYARDLMQLNIISMVNADIHFMHSAFLKNACVNAMYVVKI